MRAVNFFLKLERAGMSPSFPFFKLIFDWLENMTIWNLGPFISLCHGTTSSGSYLDTTLSIDSPFRTQFPNFPRNARVPPFPVVGSFGELITGLSLDQCSILSDRIISKIRLSRLVVFPRRINSQDQRLRLSDSSMEVSYSSPQASVCQ
jgi:hypothetical protein